MGLGRFPASPPPNSFINLTQYPFLYLLLPLFPSPLNAGSLSFPARVPLLLQGEVLSTVTECLKKVFWVFFRQELLAGWLAGLLAGHCRGNPDTGREGRGERIRKYLSS